MARSSPAIDADRLLAFLERLVAIDTSNPPGLHYAVIAELLRADLEAAGLQAEVLPVAAEDQERFPNVPVGYPRCNVLARLDVGAARTLHFNAHFDVVPAANEGWTSPPFTPRRAAGWVYGRGTADMKGAIAAVSAALHALRASGGRPACNLEVSFVCDEETGSELGAALLIRQKRVRPDFAIVCEGGSGPRICVGHNGTLWYEVAVAGKAAHASTPDRGRNAFEAASALALDLRAYGARIARRSFKAQDGYVLRPTLNLGGQVTTGEGAKINTVPAELRFTVDRRVIASEDIDDADQEFRAHLRGAKRRIPGLRCSIRNLERNPPVLVDHRTVLPRAVQDALARERRVRARFSVSTGFNDMHWFARDAGIPVIGYGPGGERFHAVDERARVRDLVETASVYLHLMQTFDGRAA